MSEEELDKSVEDQKSINTSRSTQLPAMGIFTARPNSPDMPPKRSKKPGKIKYKNK